MAEIRAISDTRKRKQREGGGEDTEGQALPVIHVVGSELPRVLKEAEAALIASESAVFQRGGQVVRPVLQRLKASDDRETMGWHLVPVVAPDLVVMLTDAARFEKYDRRSEAWIGIDAPEKVATAYLASVGRWQLPILTGVITTPFLRPDGSVCSEAGYDSVTGLLFKSDCQFPTVPDRRPRGSVPPQSRIR
jgi:putative DNA primase/helicase